MGLSTIQLIRDSLNLQLKSWANKRKNQFFILIIQTNTGSLSKIGILEFKRSKPLINPKLVYEVLR